MIEIKFPDLTVARYSRERVLDLLTLQSVERVWPARFKGAEEWFTVEHLLGLTSAPAAEPATAGPQPPPVADGITVGASLEGCPVSAPSKGTPEIRAEPAARQPLQNNETVISSIGQKSLVGFLKGEGLSMTNIILTDKRIYGRGKVIGKSLSAEAWLVGDVSAVSAVALFKASEWRKLVFGIFLFFVSFVASQYSNLISASTFTVGTVSVILYFLSRRKILQINLNGLAYDFAMGGVDDEHIRSFMEQTILFLANRNKW